MLPKQNKLNLPGHFCTRIKTFKINFVPYLQRSTIFDSVSFSPPEKPRKSLTQVPKPTITSDIKKNPARASSLFI